MSSFKYMRVANRMVAFAFGILWLPTAGDTLPHQVYTYLFYTGKRPALVPTAVKPVTSLTTENIMVFHTHPLLLSSWVLVSTVSAALLQPLQNINNQLPSPYGFKNETGFITLSNATTLSPDPSADLNTIRAQCNGERFGSGLNLASCRAALDDIFPDDDYSSFGRRHDGNRYDCALPYRWLSSKWKSGLTSFSSLQLLPFSVPGALLQLSLIFRR